MPVNPAMSIWHTAPTLKSIGTLKISLPPHIVPSQLKIFMPVGTAMAAVEATKKALAYEVMPTVNMWWAQTLRLIKPMAKVATTMIE